MSVWSPMHGPVLILLICMGFNHVKADPFIDGILADAATRNASSSIETHKKWRKALPRCAEGISGLSEDWPESGKVTRLRGVLKQGTWLCTLKGCPNSGCCNRCNGEWELVSKAEFLKKGEKGKAMPIMLAGKKEPLRHFGMDCALDSLRRLPYLEVVASGNLGEEGSLINATICVMGEMPRPSLMNRPGGK